jgi:hypothetical protein
VEVHVRRIDPNRRTCTLSKGGIGDRRIKRTVGDLLRSRQRWTPKGDHDEQEHEAPT